MDYNFTTGTPNNPDIPLALKRIESALRSGVLSNQGPFVRQLESEIAEYLGVDYALCVTNSSIGFDIVLEVLDLPKGAEVITPSLTFPAFVHSIKRKGLTPVFCDVDDSCCITPKTVEKVITKNTKLIVPAHLFGNLCKEEFPFDVPVIYDSAHALGCAYESGDYVGKQGKASLFSLHSTKLVGCGEGGVICTQDQVLAKRLVEYRNFGYQQSGGYFPQGNLVGFGTNAKMDEIRAALGTVNFANLPFIQEHLFENHKLYKELLPDLIKDKNCYFSNWSYVVAEVPAYQKDNLLEDLYAAKILARTYFAPLHLNPIYRDYCHYSLPNTERIAKQIVVLPTGLAIGKPEIEFIVDTIKRSLNGG